MKRLGLEKGFFVMAVDKVGLMKGLRETSVQGDAEAALWASYHFPHAKGEAECWHTEHC